MEIKAIQIKNKRVSIEGEDATFTLHLEAYLEASLREGDVLNEATLAKLKARSTYFDAADKAFKALSYKPYTVFAMKKKLRQTFDETTIQAVIRMLKDHCYLDDQTLLDQRLEEAIAFEHKGPKHYQQAFMKLGFPLAMIQEALHSVSDDVWQARCVTHLENTLKQQKDKPPMALKQTLFQAGLRAGYDSSMVNEALSQLTIDTPDEEALLKARLAKEQARVDLSNPAEKQKFIQRLMRQGYRYDTIKKLIG